MPARTYTPRPPTVTAIQYDGTNTDEVAELVGVDGWSIEAETLRVYDPSHGMWLDVPVGCYVVVSGKRGDVVMSVPAAAFEAGYVEVAG